MMIQWLFLYIKKQDKVGFEHICGTASELQASRRGSSWQELTDLAGKHAFSFFMTYWDVIVHKASPPFFQ